MSLVNRVEVFYELCRFALNLAFLNAKERKVTAEGRRVLL